MTESSDASRAAERVARDSYGRLVALLAYRWRDLAAAQDALGDAFAAALERWPRDGIPDAPEAWLMAASKRRLLHAARHDRVRRDPGVLALFDGCDETEERSPTIPDERLKLLFVCAHPALAESIRAPLMLQAVLGVDARAIAAACLVSPTAMAQRLVRAKAKIRDAGFRFEEPGPDELPERLDAILESIYGAYAIGSRQHREVGGAGMAETGGGLTGEALALARIVVALLPDEPEASGLFALICFCEARRRAGFDAAGRFVPLGRQDPSDWRRDLIDEAEGWLSRAARCGRPGPFQLEAAIQSAHCQRISGMPTPWAAIARLYDRLAACGPSVGTEVGRAVAHGESGDPRHALSLLSSLPEDAVRSYQPYWVARAHLLRMDHRSDEADEALVRAIGLTADPRIRDYLLGQTGTEQEVDAAYDKR